jgi:hypothetical protein
MKYQYQVVSGAAVFGVPTTIHQARRSAIRLAAMPEWYGWQFEVERVRTLDNGARRYWRQERGRWVLQ